MKPNLPDMARTRHVWCAARQQTRVLACDTLAASRNCAGHALPSPCEASEALPLQSISFAHILPTFFREH